MYGRRRRNKWLTILFSFPTSFYTVPYRCTGARPVSLATQTGASRKINYYGVSRAFVHESRGISVGAKSYVDVLKK